MQREKHLHVWAVKFSSQPRKEILELLWIHPSYSGDQYRQKEQMEL